MRGEPSTLVGNVINDPEKAYTTPDSVLTDSRLTPSEKDKILHSWEQDQLALLRAEDESMVKKDGTPPATVLLEKVKAAEKALDVMVSPVTTAR